MLKDSQEYKIEIVFTPSKDTDKTDFMYELKKLLLVSDMYVSSMSCNTTDPFEDNLNDLVGGYNLHDAQTYLDSKGYHLIEEDEGDDHGLEPSMLYRLGTSEVIIWHSKDAPGYILNIEFKEN